MLSSKIRFLKGIGEKREKLFENLGIHTVSDLLRFPPRGYEDRRQFEKISNLRVGETVCVCATAASEAVGRIIRRGLTISKFRIFDDSGAAEVVFYNRAYTAKQIKRGERYIFYGKIEISGSNIAIINPDFEAVSGEAASGRGAVTGRILPIYPLTRGLTRNSLMRNVLSALGYVSEMEDIIPRKLRQKRGLCGVWQAYEQLHFPDSLESAKAARERLVYEECLLLCLRLYGLRGDRTAKNGIKMKPVDLERFTEILPFCLTGAQMNAINDAFSDMMGNTPMNRLVQGDVGCGKTMVAAACIYLAAKNGYQSALMTPTEILAKQHYNKLAPLFDKLGIKTVLLTGSSRGKAKMQTLSQIKSGEAQVIIGTHAIITESVEYNSLALAVTDEQHRFGVAQRKSLSAKGENVHTLVMSATPIPRTLALIMYGELDVSSIRDMPSGRKPVETFLISEDKRQRMYGFIKKLLDEGRQAYIVCPAIEAENEDDFHAAAAYAEYVSGKAFRGYRTALLHGKMSARDKDSVMSAFAEGKIQLLVSTTVIEVGVDVPNACVMVIEGAEKFGLSTLHQLRGRVGRGTEKSYCILVSSSKNAKTRERLGTIVSTSDGFEIGEADLKERGPGEFFGSRQHGLPTLHFASFAENMEVLSAASDDAKEILASDGINTEEFAPLKSALALYENEIVLN